MTTLVTQADCEAAGLLALHYVLEKLGWRWSISIHGEKCFITLSAEHTKQTFTKPHIATIIAAVEDKYRQLFISLHDGSGLSSDSCREVTYMDYPT